MIRDLERKVISRKYACTYISCNFILHHVAIDMIIIMIIIMIPRDRRINLNKNLQRNKNLLDMRMIPAAKKIVRYTWRMATMEREFNGPIKRKSLHCCNVLLVV